MKLLKLSLTAAAMMPLVWLAGCASDPLRNDDFYQPAMHWERYPIEVAKGAVRLDVSSRRADLTARQEESVTRFAHQALSSGASQIEVKHPAGATAETVAERVAELLIAGGVPAAAISRRSYAASKGAPVIVTFDRKFAVTGECGDWSEDIAITGDNTPPLNFGCATQHNIAAVVANPEDFETPRTATPSDAMRRNQVFVDYRKPKNTATGVSSSETQTVSDVGQQ